MASKLNSTKSNLTIITNKLRDLNCLNQEKLCPRNAKISKELTTDFKTKPKKPKSITCHPIKSMEILKPQNQSAKQLRCVSNCPKKDKLCCQINNQKPCQPIKPSPSEPNSLDKVGNNNSKTKFEKTTSERSLKREATKVVQDIKKSPEVHKLSMKNSKLLKRPKTSATINHHRTISSATNNITLTSKSIQSSNRSTLSAKSAKSSSISAWKSPFKNFITTGVRTRKHLYGCPESHEFSYDLSHEELKCLGKFEGPMKPAPERERQILTNGQRIEYLTQRYEHSPHKKYNYPEATSWRIGWLQQQQQQNQQYPAMESVVEN